MMSAQLCMASSLSVSGHSGMGFLWSTTPFRVPVNIGNYLLIVNISDIARLVHIPGLL